MDNVTLAVQARVGWEFGGRVPREYTLSLATQTNAQPLPAVPEVSGLRLPPANECLTAIDFDLVPNRPPAGGETIRRGDRRDRRVGVRGRRRGHGTRRHPRRRSRRPGSSAVPGHFGRGSPSSCRYRPCQRAAHPVG
ncbi:hypothetical protein F5148DRAFT_424645 [Russula earlei]|uniref:Uncharacterized protein n=1 Tax=Russula earlei TaxID=71964 RepID=A0ACC0TZ88_9AGAM|nr:hypothetical protein F5148DRAFT_424645 [Russula earlei]